MKLIRWFTIKSILKSMTYKKCPLYVQIQTTPLCNQNCEFCGVIHSFDKKNQLSFNDFKIMRNNLVKMNIGTIVLTGGEPMLREDIYEIINLFSVKGVEIRLQTNGTLLTKEAIQKLNESKLSGLTLSLDSLQEKKQNAFTRTKSFKKIIEGIVNASKYGKFNIIAINIVINKNNLEEIEDIVRFATELNIFVSLIPIHNENKLFSNKNAQDSKNFFNNEEDFLKLKRVLNNVVKMKKGGYLIINSYKHLLGIYNFLKFKKCKWKCDSPFLYFSIRPDGTFSPCIEYKTKYNFVDENFINTYNSKEFRGAIRKIVNNCEGCYYPCWCEVSFFVKNPLILLERSIQLLKHKDIKNINYDEVISKYVKYDVK